MILAKDAEEFRGINTRKELAQAENILQNRWRELFLNQGVTLKQPETIFFSFDTKIGKDSVVGPFVTFGVGVDLGEDVTILPYCHLENTRAEKDVVVGPFAHCRGENILRNASQVGSFVEVKGSEMGAKAKAKHLSYIGDANVGEKANIGAGTVICNYDGFQKFRTWIGPYAMIGGNSCLVSPVKIGDGAMIAAGSVITQNVPDHDLAIARQKQVNKTLGAKKFKSKYPPKYSDKG